MITRPYRRARVTFWTLVAFAILLLGTLSRILQVPPSPGAGLAVAVLGILTAIVIALAARLLLALTGRLTAQRNRRTRPRGD